MPEFQLRSRLRKGLSIPAQLKTIQQYANFHGFRILEEYIDEGESAKTSDRPAFSKWLRGARRTNPSKLS